MDPNNTAPSTSDRFPAPLSPQELRSALAPDEPTGSGEETEAFVAKAHSAHAHWHYTEKERRTSYGGWLLFWVCFVVAWAVGFYFVLRGLGWA